MANRHRLMSTVKYGRFNDFVSNIKELNEICAARGWSPMRMMAPVVGENNLVVVESDYPDLATFEREMNEFYSDAEAMKVWRAGGDVIIEGTARDELLM